MSREPLPENPVPDPDLPTGRLNDDEADPTRGKSGAMPTDVQGDEVDPGAGDGSTPLTSDGDQLGRGARNLTAPTPVEYAIDFTLEISMTRSLIGGLALATLIAASGASAQQAASRTSPTRVVGDAAAGPVGLASAATLGSMNSHAFVENAARSDMYEIGASKLAETRSHNPAIKAFARMMVRDHTHTTAELKAHLPAGITPPTGLDARRSGMLDNLREGADFDSRYVAQQITAHEEALTLMRGFAKRGDNAGLKMVAAKAVPLIEHHLQMAKALKAKVGK